MKVAFWNRDMVKVKNLIVLVLSVALIAFLAKKVAMEGALWSFLLGLSSFLVRLWVCSGDLASKFWWWWWWALMCGELRPSCLFSARALSSFRGFSS